MVARCCRRGSGAGVVPEWRQWRQWRRARLDTSAWTSFEEVFRNFYESSWGGSA